LQIDGLILNTIIKDLKANISRQKVKKVFMPKDGRFFITFQFSTLIISLLPESFFIGLIEEKEESPYYPSAFVMLLRKYIKNSTLENISQIGLDRGLILKFLCRLESGEEKIFNLIVELMGRSSNLIFADEDMKILDAFRKKVNESRTILPNTIYSPYKRDSINILSDPFESISEKLISETGYLQGFGKYHLDELFFRAGIEKDKNTEDKKILHSLNKIREEIENADSLYIYKKEHKEIISPFLMASLLEAGYTPEKHTITEAVEIIFSEKNSGIDLNKEKERLFRVIEKEIKKTENLLFNLEEDLKETHDSELLAKKATLLVGNLYKLNPSAKRETVEVINWETNVPWEIELDPRYTIADNSQIMFKKFAKMKRRKAFLGKRIIKTEEYLFYLNQIRQSITDSTDREGLTEIEREMKDEKIIKEKKAKKEKKQTNNPGKLHPRKFINKEFTILVGKNNYQNDYISKNASDNDLWLHTKETPGSHVIIKGNNTTCPQETILYAAKLAARFSKAWQSSNVAVDFTEIKNVRKPKGAKPGLVIYKNFKTVNL